MNLEKKFPEKLVQKTLLEIVNFLKSKKIIKENCKASIGFKNLSEKEIQKLNKVYRNKNQSTDILSFGYNFNDDFLEGDLVLCWEIIQKNAKDDKIKSREELKKNLIHGCLHLSGFKHSNKMFKIQNDFLKF